MLRSMLAVLILIIMEGTIMAKPRLLVLTDIGGDPDDEQSLVRLLMYSNHFDIEGLIATSYGYEHLINAQINAFGQVRSNLRVHASDYPTAQYLLDRVKLGAVTPERGADYVGSGHDTEGSNHIITVVDKSDARPVNVAIWGGQTDLAQALWKVKNNRSASAYQAFVSKLRVHAIGDQDGMFSFIRSSFPELWYIFDFTHTSDKCKSVFRGMFFHGDYTTVTLSWLRNNIKNNHGPLGALYPDQNLWSCGNGIDGIKEGDTPSWFYFLENGLNMPSDPGAGGWGGRFYEEWDNYYRDAADSYGGETSGLATVFRWREEFQNNFKARMDWCVTGSYANGNHEPVAVVNYNRQTVNAGDVVLLDATGASDPDGDGLSYEWMYYKEAGSYGGSLSLTNGTKRMASFTAPSVTSDKTIHIILKVKDDGSPAMTSYQRVVVTVQPYTAPDNESPAASITAPAEGASLTAGAVLNYSGTGTDPEDGILDGTSLAWSIDRNGDGLGAVHTGTGTGGSYTLPSDIAVTTTYTVKLTVTDGDGATDTETHSVFVEPVPSLPAGHGRMEAEHMDLSGYAAEAQAAASGGNVIKTDNMGTARYEYDGAAGKQDIAIGYFDENDGTSDYTLYLNGEAIESWSADEDRGSASPDETSALVRTVAGITLAPGDEIKISGTKDSGEFGRVDFIETVPAMTTGISIPPVEQSIGPDGAAVRYDLQGRRVPDKHAVPGIYLEVMPDGRLMPGVSLPD